MRFPFVIALSLALGSFLSGCERQKPTEPKPKPDVMDSVENVRLLECGKELLFGRRFNEEEGFVILLNPAVGRARFMGRFGERNTSIESRVGSDRRGGNYGYYSMTISPSIEWVAWSEWAAFHYFELHRSGSRPGRLEASGRNIVSYDVVNDYFLCETRDFSGADDLNNKVAAYKAMWEAYEAKLQQKEQAKSKAYQDSLKRLEEESIY